MLLDEKMNRKKQIYLLVRFVVNVYEFLVISCFRVS